MARAFNSNDVGEERARMLETILHSIVSRNAKIAIGAPDFNRLTNPQ